LTSPDALVDVREARRGRVGPEQLPRFEAWIAEIFEAMGMPGDTAGTRRTPARFLSALYDSTEGYECDPRMPTSVCAGRDVDPGRHVVEGPIGFHSLCERHALPFFGHAFVGCVGPDRALAPGALTGVVRVFARRFTLPERAGEQIADAIERLVHSRGSAVVLRSVHLCTQVGGAEDVERASPTVIWRGAYVADPRLRSELLGICGLDPADTATTGFGGVSCIPGRARSGRASPSWGRERRETPSCTSSERRGSTARSP
jgi:GTP cyclohydrolase I